MRVRLSNRRVWGLVIPVSQRQNHRFKEECASPGICFVATEPISVESIFVGKRSTFQYTKVLSPLPVLLTKLLPLSERTLPVHPGFKSLALRSHHPSKQTHT